MKKLLMLAAVLAMALMAAVPAMAQEAPVNPDTTVSGAPGDGTTSSDDCEDLKATGADVDCDAQRTPDEPVGETPDEWFGSRAECERFNEQYGTEIDCSVLRDAGTVSGDGGNAPNDPPTGGAGSSGGGAAGTDGGATSSDDGGGRTLPATGGGTLVALGAGASLIACGLLARKLLARN